MLDGQLATMVCGVDEGHNSAWKSDKTQQAHLHDEDSQHDETSETMYLRKHAECHSGGSGVTVSIRLQDPGGGAILRDNVTRAVKGITVCWDIVLVRCCSGLSLSPVATMNSPRRPVVAHPLSP